MSEHPLRTPEGQAFLAKLHGYRATLPAHEQALLDGLVRAAGGSHDDVEGYVLFGGGTTFGASQPFGSGTPGQN